MKKILSVVLLTAMLAATLASCSGEDAPADTTPAATTTTASTTPKPQPPTTELPPDDPRQVETLPILNGDGLEELLADKTRLSDPDSTIKVEMSSLVSLGFSPWQTYESINELFDGVDTEDEWYYTIDETTGEKVLKDGANPTTENDGPNGGGPGKIGGPLNQNGYQGGYFFFALTDKATISAYVITTGNDNSKFADRNPVEWTLYATNDAELFANASVDGAVFDPTAWTELDYVYDGKVTEANFTPNGYVIDEANQGEYQYYVWHLNYTKANLFQACELDLYIG